VDHLCLTWSYFVNVLVPQAWKGDGVYMHGDHGEEFSSPIPRLPKVFM